MSPEQADLQKEGLDTRSDVYSLGVVLYELLTGTTPVHAVLIQEKGVEEFRRIIRDEDPPLPSLRSNTLPANAASTNSHNRSVTIQHFKRALRGELDWIVMRALERDPVRRYQSVSDMIADAERYLSNRPVTARPVSIAYRVHKLVRRYQSGFGIACAATALILMSIIVLVCQQGQLKSARNLVESSNSRRERAAREMTMANGAAAQKNWPAVYEHLARCIDFTPEDLSILRDSQPAHIFFQQGPEYSAKLDTLICRQVQLARNRGDNHPILQRYIAMLSLLEPAITMEAPHHNAEYIIALADRWLSEGADDWEANYVERRNYV
jgi:serine/threonine protein kinase